MKRAIVTGATGFVGSNLCKHLVENKWKVFAIVRPSSNYRNINYILNKIEIFEYDGDIKNLINYFKVKEVDAIFHLASLFIVEHVSKQIDDLVDSNLKFGLHILEAMKESKTKILINTGTSWQYYNTNDYNPVNLYAATKEAFEKLVKYYVEAEGIRSITLKLFDTYGETDTRPKLINLLHKFADENKELDMTLGEQEIDLVHVDDVISAYISTYEYLDSNKDISYDEFAISSGKEINLKELIDLFEKVTKKKLNINWGGKDYRKREVMKLWRGYKILPGWNCRITLEEGLKRYESFEK